MDYDQILTHPDFKKFGRKYGSLDRFNGLDLFFNLAQKDFCTPLIKAPPFYKKHTPFLHFFFPSQCRLPLFPSYANSVFSFLLPLFHYSFIALFLVYSTSNTILLGNSSKVRQWGLDGNRNRWEWLGCWLAG